MYVKLGGAEKGVLAQQNPSSVKKSYWTIELETGRVGRIQIQSHNISVTIGFLCGKTYDCNKYKISL